MKESKKSNLLNSGLPFQVMYYIIFLPMEKLSPGSTPVLMFVMYVCILRSINKFSNQARQLSKTLLPHYFTLASISEKSLASYQNITLPADGNLTQIVIQISFMNFKYFHDFIPSLLGVY